MASSAGQLVIDRQRLATDLDMGDRGPVQQGRQRPCLRGRGFVAAGPRQAPVTGGDAASGARGQAVPVLPIHDPGASADCPRMDGQQGFATVIGASGMQHDLGLRGPDFSQLARANLAGRHRVEIRVEGDEAVLADMAEMPLSDHTASAAAGGGPRGRGSPSDR